MFVLNHSIFILWPTPKARKRNLFSLLVISLDQPCMQEESLTPVMMHLLVILFLRALFALLGGLGLLSADTTSTAAAEW